MQEGRDDVNEQDLSGDPNIILKFKSYWYELLVTRGKIIIRIYPLSQCTKYTVTNRF